MVLRFSNESTYVLKGKTSLCRKQGRGPTLSEMQYSLKCDIATKVGELMCTAAKNAILGHFNKKTRRPLEDTHPFLRLLMLKLYPIQNTGQ